MTGNLLRNLIMITLFVACFGGCVRRRMTVRSNPPGAMLYIDDQQIGQTPVATDFIYYGTRKIKLVKDGFETMTTYQTIAPPWYQIPPFDFVSENLIGREIRDERILDFNLQPQRVIPANELLGRATGLRQSSVQGFVAPTPQNTFSPVPVYDGVMSPQPGAPQETDPFLGL